MIRSSQVSHLDIYTDALKKLSKQFVIQFKDFRDNEKGFSLFGNPFTADIDNSPIELHVELRDIQNEKDLTNAYSENDMLNFYNLHVSTE